MRRPSKNPPNFPNRTGQRQNDSVRVVLRCLEGEVFLHFDAVNNRFVDL